MNKRVLIGLVEIAANTHGIGESFKKAGYDVTTVIIEKNIFYPFLNYDFIIDDFNPLKNIPKIRYLPRVIISSLFFLFNFWKYDYIIYESNISYIPFRLDQLLLKLFNKNFAIFFSGDDIRYRPIQIKIEEQNFDYIRYRDNTKKEFFKNSTFFDFTKKIYLTKYCYFLTKNIFTTRSIFTLSIKPFYKIFKPLFIDKRNIEIEKNNIITIVHAPSDSVVKNSKFILECLQELQNEGYKFNIELIQKKSNIEVLKILASSHIAIDQFAALPGRFAQEAMALECAVLGGNKHYYEQKCDEIPVIDIILDKNDFKNKIISLLNNPDKIKKLGQDGLKYIEKYHSGELFVKNSIDAMENRYKPDQTPVINSKEELLKYCSRWYEKFLIKLFL